ncbi:MAG: hypothetical protein KDA65_04480 [Planctomycetaceae bacterium]|nr:hypothetical protein [Planctomycetaceae bacterium]
MNKQLLRFLCLALVGLIAIPLQAAEPVQLKYQFSKEKPLKYRISTAMEQNQKIGDQSNEIKMVNIADSNISLVEMSEESDFVVNSTTTRLRVNMENPFSGTYEYDSNSEDNPTEGFLAGQLTPVFDALKGASVNLTISNHGDIKEVKGYEELMNKIMEKMPAAAPMAKNFSNESAKTQYKEAFPTLPETLVAPGDQWEADFSIDLGPMGKAEGKKVYTFKGPSEVEGRKTVAIEVKHDIEIDIKVNQGLSSVTGKLKTKDSSGLIHFDPALGEVVRVENQYLIVGNLKVMAGGQVQVVESSQNHKITVDQIPETTTE